MLYTTTVRIVFRVQKLLSPDLPLKSALNLNLIHENLCIWVLGKLGLKMKRTSRGRAPALHSCDAEPEIWAINIP